MILGLDLGRQRDPSALIALQSLDVRHIERWSLGTPYPDVIERATGMRDSLDDSELVIDATGVGRAVLDYVEGPVVPIVITSGKNVKRMDDCWHVPKVELLRPALVGFERGKLRIAKRLKHGTQLANELGAFRRSLTGRGNTRYEGSGEHDDLVLALALALWWGHVGKVLESQQVRKGPL